MRGGTQPEVQPLGYQLASCTPRRLTMALYSTRLCRMPTRAAAQPQLSGHGPVVGEMRGGRVEV